MSDMSHGWIGARALQLKRRSKRFAADGPGGGGGGRSNPGSPPTSPLSPSTHRRDGYEPLESPADIQIQVRLCVCSSVSVSVFSSVCLSVCLTVCLSIFLSICLYVCVFICLSVCRPVHLETATPVSTVNFAIRFVYEDSVFPHKDFATNSNSAPITYVSLRLRVQNVVPAQPCVGKLGISLVLLNFLHCNFRL